MQQTLFGIWLVFMFGFWIVGRALKTIAKVNKEEAEKEAKKKGGC